MISKRLILFVKNPLVCRLSSNIERSALGVRRWAFASSGRQQPTAYSLQPAFTLIEVLVAMTVLAIMVLMVANIFQSSSASWNIGTQKADMNTAARAALDLMARELSAAVAGPVEKAESVSPIYLQFKLTGENEVFFVALSGDLKKGRALRGVSFYMTNNQLMYARQTESFLPYDDLPDKSGPGMLITNVTRLDFYVYTNENDLTIGKYVEIFPVIVSNELPICVDVAIEMLSDDDMARYVALNAHKTEQDAFKARNAKLYSTRVYFPNRKGYAAH